MSGVVCYWPDGATECPNPAERYRAQRERHWWIPCCATHAADAAPEDLQPVGEWLLPMTDA